MTHELSDRLAVWGHRKRAYVIADKKIVFISLAKNACTTLKWTIAELAGEDLSRFGNRLSSGTSPDDVVHVRGQWKKAVMLGDVDPEVRRTIHPDNGWYVFAVVRDPRSRVFSAWQNKFLMHNPKFVHMRDEPWYPALPHTNEDVVESFARFIEMLRADPAHELHGDSHFSTQVALLSEHEIDYTRIYDVSEMSTLVSDLEAHLAGVGHPTTITLRHSNDTPLAANADCFPGPVREQVEELYAADLERFPDLWDFGRIEAKPAWTDRDLAQVRLAAGMGDRIGELRRTALHQRSRLEQQRAKIEALRGELRQQREAAEESDPALLDQLRSLRTRLPRRS